MNVLATLHIADLFRDPRMHLPTQLDWRKIPAILAGTWPKPVPPALHVSASSWAEAEAWFLAAVQAPYVACDTEFDPDSKFLTFIGVGIPGDPPRGLLFDWRGSHPSWVRVAYIQAFYRLVRRVPIVYQNAMADIPVLEQNFHVCYQDYHAVEDTMLAHAVLWSEWPHELEFLASLYSQYPKLKHLAHENLALYNWGDVLATLDTWAALLLEFTADPASERIYREQSLPLIPIILERHARGIRVNTARVEPARREYEAKMEDAARLARAWTGRPMYVGSSTQVADYCYRERGYPVQTNKDTRKPTVGNDAIAVLRQRLGPAYDPDEDVTLDRAIARMEEGADGVLEARVMYMAAQQALSHYIMPLYEEG